MSRAPVQDYRPEDLELENETKNVVQQLVQSITATEKRLKEIQVSQQEDEVCKQVTSFVANEWPPKSQLRGEVKKYYSVLSELSMVHGLGAELSFQELGSQKCLSVFMQDTRA